MVLKKILLTEKVYRKGDGMYCFLVDANSNKTDVKNVIENLFHVKVGKVNISNLYCGSKIKYSRGKHVWCRDKKGKKAWVFLKVGTINLDLASYM